jgi:hypothetical protein
MAKITTVLAGDLALLPLQPIAPVTETLQYLTDLFQSHNGKEGVLQLRAAPRQSFKYTYPEQAWQKQAGFNVQYGALSKSWAIPVWTEAQYIGTIANGSGALSCTTDVYDFRGPGLCFIWQDDSHFQLLDVASVSSGLITFHSGQTANAYTGAYVMPCRYGRVSGSFSRKVNADNIFTDVVFSVDDTATITDAAAPTQYLGDDLYTDAPEDNGVSRVVNTRIDLLDYDLGPVTQRATWINNRVDYQRNILCANAQEVRAFKQWFQRRAGKFKRFWEPSFDNDLRKQSTGVVSSALLVARDNLTDWASLPRNHIAVELDDGSWLVRAISSIATISGSQLQLNLDSALAVSATQIRRISWLGLKRLNTDQVELTWQGGGVMQTNMQVTELNP